MPSCAIIIVNIMLRQIVITRGHTTSILIIIMQNTRENNIHLMTAYRTMGTMFFGPILGVAREANNPPPINPPFCQPTNRDLFMPPGELMGARGRRARRLGHPFKIIIGRFNDAHTAIGINNAQNIAHKTGRHWGEVNIWKKNPSIQSTRL